MGNHRGTLVLTGLLLLVLAVPAGHAHEQKTLTIIMTEDGVVSGNITDPSFVQGNSVWFQMHDDQANATMRVQLDTNFDGMFNATEDFDSGELVNECELDGNGTLVDENCAVSALFTFDPNATVETYAFRVIHNFNGTETVWNHSIMLHKDVHEEEGPAPGDCFGVGCETEKVVEESSDTVEEEMNPVIVGLAAVSLLGMILLTVSLFKESRNKI